MTVTVSANSISSATAIATALSSANSAAVSTQLVAAGVTHVSVNATVPQLSKPGASSATLGSGSGQAKRDLLALLVLLIVLVPAALFGGKYLQRRRVEAQAEAKAHALDTTTMYESA